MQRQGFQMGEHVFLVPGVRAPIDRFKNRPGRPLRGAVPPKHLAERVRESDERGPARLLWDGQFCGHGEPTYGVFDLVCGVCDLFELQMAGGNGERVYERPALLLARPIDGSSDWFPICDVRHHPEAKCCCREGEPTPSTEFWSPAGLPHTQFRVALGFEYPVDCDSADAVSWFAVAIESANGAYLDIVFEEET